MGQDERIAGRINIKYVPKSDGQGAQEALPFRTLVLGDFSGGAQEGDLHDRRPLSIDKESFADRLKAQNLSVDMTVPNRLSAEPDARLPVRLKIDKMGDFAPDSLVQQVPELRSLVELREALLHIQRIALNERDLRRILRDVARDPSQARALIDELKASVSPSADTDVEQ